jgi:hypothetical protein
MRTVARYAALLAGALAAGGCEETSTETGPVEFTVTIRMESSFAALGDTLVGDTVLFVGAVRKNGEPYAASGARYTSSDTTVVRILDAEDGRALLKGVGLATVAVSFDEPAFEGTAEKLGASMPVRVTDYEVEYFLTSEITSDTLGVEEGLETDSVRVGAIVRKDGAPVPSAGLRVVSSSRPAVVAVAGGGEDVVVLADSGAAVLRVTLQQPDVPGPAPLTDSVRVRVGTYAVELSGPAAPAMGDSVQYGVDVRDTRADTGLTSYQVEYASSDSAVIRLLNKATGLAFARDVGTTTVSVRLLAPDLPRGNATAALAPTNVTQERFYGRFSRVNGDFGDTVKVYASEVHRFTDSTRVFFGNGTSLFADTSWADSLRAIVGAGTDSTRLVFRNLRGATGASFRDNVLSRVTFGGRGTVADAFEPNDTFPLPDTAAVNLTGKLPFRRLLSLSPTTDRNFFWINVPGPLPQVFDVRAETQQSANIDFIVCNGIGNPPTSYDPTTCARPAALNDQGANPRVEEQIGLSLPQGRHVFRFYCAAGGCPAVPVTYKVTIKQSGT